MIEASWRGYTEIVKYLVENRADINLQDGDGETALMGASNNGYIEIVKYLVENKADINLQNHGYYYNDGNTALIAASWNEHVDIVKILLEAGADIEIQNEDGRTALMSATISGQTDIVKILIDAGATLDAKDSDGNTALIYAIEEGHTDIIALLEKGRTAFQEIGKPYRTIDNLRLRQNEGTAGTPLFTLPKGASVKVLARDNMETIDGIRANWVQVEVANDTVSVQGDRIKAGSVGWCFGGYLGEF